MCEHARRQLRTNRHTRRPGQRRLLPTGGTADRKQASNARLAIVRTMACPLLLTAVMQKRLLNVLYSGIAITAGAAIGACESSSGSTGPVPIDGLINQIVAADCALLVRCHQTSDPAFCAAFIQAATGGGDFNSAGAIVAAVKAGKVSYDGNSARTCLDQLSSEACSDFFDASSSMPMGCDKVFTGKVKDGDRCIADVECMSKSFCASAVSTGFQKSCDGICTRGGPLCNDDTHCGSGEVCDFSAGTTTSNGTCVTPVRAGGPNQPCGTNSACQPGLTCFQSGQGSICTAPGQAGQLCQGFCADGLICVPGDNTFAATCVAPAGKGESCQVREQCGGLLSSLICDETVHRCVDRPSSGPCPTPGSFGGGCNSLTSFCDTSLSTPTCQPFGTTCNDRGEGCGFNAVCQTSASQSAGSLAGTCVTEGMACVP